MSRKVNGLTVLRVVAVLMVVMVHFGQSLSLPGPIGAIVKFGMYGVQIFFLLSGYLIFESLSRTKTISEYWAKRAVRIFPVYYVVILINYVVFELFFRAMPTDTTHIGWLRYVLCLQTSIPSTSVQYWNNLSAMWSVPAFVLFYLIAPLAYRVIKNFERSVVLMSSSIAVTYLVGVLANVAGGTEYKESILYLSGKNPISVLWVFLLGGCVWQAKKDKRFLCFPFAIGLIGLIYGEMGFARTSFFALLLFVLVDVKPLRNVYISRCVALLDEYSFSIYLGHTTALTIVAYIRDTYSLGMLWILVLSVFVTVFLVVFLHQLVEKPCEKLLKGRLANKKAL